MINKTQKVYNEINKKYYEAFLQAQKSGVEVLFYQSNINKEEIYISHNIDLNLNV